MDISVIIPVYNDSEGLRDTVASFVAQDYPGDFEVIVVDNASNDGTSNVAKQLASQYRQVVFRSENRRGSYAARNSGVGVAKGDIICFIDADVTVDNDYLTGVDSFLRQNSVDYLGVRVVMKAVSSNLAVKCDQLFAFPVKHYIDHFHFAPTCCLSVRKSVLDAVGGFDARLESGGDKNFGNKVFAAGYVMAYAEHLIVKHPTRNSVPQLKSKAKRIGRGIAQQYFHHPQTYRDHFKACFSPFNLFRIRIIGVFKNRRERRVVISFLDCMLVALLEWRMRILGAYSTFVTYRELKREAV